MVGEDLANLNIMDEEEDPLVVVGDDISADPKYRLCLVGRVLTDSVVNFPSLKKYSGRFVASAKSYAKNGRAIDEQMVVGGIRE
ncbi:hypothetical protein PVK06_010976 [Gossypium arboreum]|uniref:Uncharacterized protein n=1 Tax=Gossypium arboreum TaxID=29729 RepID=A0ABR0Q7N0_GOSAR|nr:hypothetical protein PVK06_010976 [Gossypium arboreum]